MMIPCTVHSFFEEIKKNLLANGFTNQINLIDLHIAAEDLEVKDQGKFDLIYSINVLEHILRFRNSLVSMQSDLGKNGTMPHTCPNYHIPYEPHFAILIAPFIPRLTTCFIPNLRKSELWNSLNFVSSTSLRHICYSLGLEIKLYPNVMYDTFIRLDEDEAFRRCQNPFVLMIYSFLKINERS